MQKRFKCNSCFKHCEATFEVLDGDESTNPTRCLVDPDGLCAWTPIGELKPPKLTQEIFETDECPSWAEYVAVDGYGHAYFFSSKPVMDPLNGAWYPTAGSVPAKSYHGGKFDATTWSSSLIKRESKIPEPPAWVYNAEYGYHQEYGYVRLDEIMEMETQITIINTGETRYVYNAIFSNGKIVEARKRPFNEKEMRELVGKVIENDNVALLVTSYGKHTGDIDTYCGIYTAEDLRDSGFVIDGKPCCKLEHLNEKGEWVE